MLLTDHKDTNGGFDDFTREVSEPFCNNVNIQNSLWIINWLQKETFKLKEHKVYTAQQWADVRKSYLRTSGQW